MKKSIIRIILITIGILLIPLIAMQFSNEVNWSLFDFIAMGVMIFSTGFIYELVIRKHKTTVYRIAFAVGIGGAFLLAWVNGAVGIIGNEAGFVNLMYGAVFFTGLVGAVASRFKASGMAITLWLAAVVQMLIPITALIIWPPPSISWSPGVVNVFMLNAFFATLFTISGLLFKQASVVSHH